MLFPEGKRERKKNKEGKRKVQRFLRMRI